MDFRISTSSRKPIYQQLAEQVRAAVAQGRLRTGERLPSVRELSRELVVNTSAELKTEIATTDVLIDAPPPHREIEINIDIYFPKEKIYHPLHEVSPVVEALAHTQFDDYVKRVRIFAHPRIANALRDLPNFDTVLNDVIEDLSQ